MPGNGQACHGFAGDMDNKRHRRTKHGRKFDGLPREQTRCQQVPVSSCRINSPVATDLCTLDLRIGRERVGHVLRHMHLPLRVGNRVNLDDRGCTHHTAKHCCEC